MPVIEILTDLMNHLGYGGVIAITALEYACFPLSSELLLPFLGFCAAKGTFQIFLTILCSTMGSVLGCSFCYAVGRFGRSTLDKVLFRFKTIQVGILHAEKSFSRFGSSSVFWARLFPIARTYISFPAGIAKMPYYPFLAYSTAGSFLWNTLFISMGYFMGERYLAIKQMVSIHKYWICIFLLFAIFLTYLLFNAKKKRNHPQNILR